jgi:pilus assembly protein TadC
MIPLCFALAALPWVAQARGDARRTAGLGIPPPTLDLSTGKRIDATVLLELLGAALSAGASIPRALAAVGSCVDGADRVVLTRAATALRRGAAWQHAWADMPPRLRTVAQALQSSWEEGAAPATALAAAADELRRTRREAGRVAAGRLAVRLVLPLGACFLPSFVLIGLAPVVIALGGGLFGGTGG